MSLKLNSAISNIDVEIPIFELNIPNIELKIPVFELKMRPIQLKWGEVFEENIRIYVNFGPMLLKLSTFQHKKVYFKNCMCWMVFLILLHSKLWRRLASAIEGLPDVSSMARRKRCLMASECLFMV